MHWPSAHGALYAPRSRGEPVIGQCFIVATAFPTLLSQICIRPDQMCIYAVGGVWRGVTRGPLVVYVD